ncbi:MAG: RluA family pseudouridine synthase [Phycisphaerales bacterium JB038]
MTDPGLEPMDDVLSGGGALDPVLVAEFYEEHAEAGEPLYVHLEVKKLVSKRLDKYLADRIPYMSRTALKRLITEGDVEVNDRPSKPAQSIKQGDRIRIHVPPPPSRDLQPEDIPLEVLYEDEHLIAINKQADLIVHPARSEKSGTLINGLAYHFQHRSSGQLSAVGEEYARPGVVHRLDRNTTGVIVAAKTEEAHWRLGRQFEKREADKRYLALVEGVLSPPADVIDLPLGPHPRRDKGYREKRVVRHDELGKPSVTIYRLLERYRGYSAVELELKTGRTHQIRVHLSHLGHPIVGDDMYGGAALTLSAPEGAAAAPREADVGDAAGEVFGRQALHAALLRLEHPISGRELCFEAPLPDDLARLVRWLRQARPPARRLAIEGASLDLDKLVGGVPSP